MFNYYRQDGMSGKAQPSPTLPHNEGNIGSPQFTGGYPGAMQQSFAPLPQAYTSNQTRGVIQSQQQSNIRGFNTNVPQMHTTNAQLNRGGMPNTANFAATNTGGRIPGVNVPAMNRSSMQNPNINQQTQQRNFVNPMLQQQARLAGLPQLNTTNLPRPNLPILQNSPSYQTTDILNAVSKATTDMSDDFPPLGATGKRTPTKGDSSKLLQQQQQQHAQSRINGSGGSAPGLSGSAEAILSALQRQDKASAGKSMFTAGSGSTTPTLQSISGQTTPTLLLDPQARSQSPTGIRGGAQTHLNPTAGSAGASGLEALMANGLSESVLMYMDYNNRKQLQMLMQQQQQQQQQSLLQSSQLSLGGAGSPTLPATVRSPSESSSPRLAALQQTPGGLLPDPLGLYSSSLHQQQQQQQQQLQASDKFGLLGLLNVIKMQDQDVNVLALGFDLTTLGLNLNSPEYLYTTFASPWSEASSKVQPEYRIPQCYYMQQPLPIGNIHVSELHDETLFYIFYCMPQDYLQIIAAKELVARKWRYNKADKLWYTRIPSTDVSKGRPASEQATYLCFDTTKWIKEQRDDCAIKYDQLADDYIQ